MQRHGAIKDAVYDTNPRATRLGWRSRSRLFLHTTIFVVYCTLRSTNNSLCMHKNMVQTRKENVTPIYIYEYICIYSN